jgi:hypothetical protein
MCSKCSHLYHLVACAEQVEIYWKAEHTAIPSQDHSMCLVNARVVLTQLQKELRVHQDWQHGEDSQG